ncbi:MAG: hypothetical protein IPK03_06815 [Bacteroidetes bacterium]|nr:hypothetical protein [Bacteroidota bacterium]
MTITTTNKPSAGLDRRTCKGGIDTLRGSSPITGIWSMQASNPIGASISGTSNGIAIVNFLQQRQEFIDLYIPLMVVQTH